MTDSHQLDSPDLSSESSCSLLRLKPQAPFSLINHQSKLESLKPSSKSTMKLTLLATVLFGLALSSPIATPETLTTRAEPTAKEREKFISERCSRYLAGAIHDSLRLSRYTTCIATAVIEWNKLHPPTPTTTTSKAPTPTSTKLPVFPAPELNNRCPEACNAGKNAMINFCNSGAYAGKGEKEFNNCIKRANELPGSPSVPDAEGVTWAMVNCWDHCIKNFGRANYGP